MRTFFLLMYLAVLAGGPAYGAERTWTIARDVYTANGELVTVRGNVAYLKIDGRVEEIPIDRLSAIDQQYIASLSLAPILPGPAADDAMENREMAHEEMPLPGEPDASSAALRLNGPDLAPVYSEQSQPMPRGAYRVDPYGRAIPPQPGVAANYLAPIPDSGNADPNDRRFRRPPQQGPNSQAAQSKRDADEDQGVLSFRARRLERQRAAARSR
jgi:hypothetical protein